MVKVKRLSGDGVHCQAVVYLHVEMTNKIEERAVFFLDFSTLI